MRPLPCRDRFWNCRGGARYFLPCAPCCRLRAPVSSPVNTRLPAATPAWSARLAVLGLTTTITLAGAILLLRSTATDGTGAIDGVRAILFVTTTFWLVLGGLNGVIGAVSPAPRKTTGQGRPVGMTAILMPIYNESPGSTFSRIAAMQRSLDDLGVADRFHFAVLSDTRSEIAAAQEVVWFARLAEELPSLSRVFYRRREQNIGRKAGNIEDFVQRSGGAYDYALILDADSLMDGSTIAEMARRMDADPHLGLLQSVPQVIGGKSIFGRAMGFASAYYGPAFARGVSMLQGNEGPYWGHNAIVRMQAFAQSCGLPALSGDPPFGGHILSHDYVEAALLARAGWKVRLAVDLEGSYEEGPENLVDYAKRDRRWCQGNLQHARLLRAPRLRLWSRFVFVQGIMAYLASPLWLLLLIAGVMGTALPDRGWHRPNASDAWILAGAVATWLILPKLAVFFRNAATGTNRNYGGTLRAAGSVVTEILLSTILAPILLFFQSRAVVQIALGLDGGWPATDRNSSRLTIEEAFAASWWMMAVSAFAVAVVLALAPATLPWLIPVAIPVVAAPALISLSSRESLTRKFFATPVEYSAPDIVKHQRRILARWTSDEVGPQRAATTTKLGGSAHA